MKVIQLTRGKEAIVDDCDHELASKHKWFAFKNGKRFYAARGVRMVLESGKVTTKIHFLHSLIMGKKNGYVVDHKNLDTLDNRKENLRWATHALNCCNTSRKRGLSGFRCVYLNHGKYLVSITCNRKHHHIGTFCDIKEAALSADRAMIKYRGEFAQLNFPPQCHTPPA